MIFELLYENAQNTENHYEIELDLARYGSEREAVADALYQAFDFLDSQDDPYVQFRGLLLTVY